MDKKRNRGVTLFISVLLHSLLALLPWQEKSRPLVVSSTPTGPISIVDASQLPTLSTSESQLSPPSPPSPAVPRSPPADSPWAADAPLPETSDSPEPAPEVVPDVDSPWAADAPLPETSDSPEPALDAAPNNNSTSVTSAEEEAKIAADWEHLVNYLQGQNEGLEKSDPLQIFNLFGEPGQVNQFFDENSQPKFDDSSFSHFLTQTPEQVWQTVVMPELMSTTDFDLQLQENFSAGLAYQLLQGEMVRYLIIVKLSEGNGSVLMISESLPELDP
ncbi:hypothetical protein N836_10480 [Leptolyngbya sp. Heron Island J]|uniref:hypothetical protein n=1 Tax=Leptolyngbya sp. Heron Island J TaxID=1385935 RepID=UPI0003B9479B|nr:hypothetical protein [Leptolyngbya sp. Heron Island J]ESA35756.1 hypothetical protein N836_10480 [Leptolyngbya sp. Heron Island J]